MDQNAFVASIVASVAGLLGAWAWPIVALIAVYVFRVQLRTWFARPPSRLKLGAFEAEWERIVAETAPKVAPSPVAQVGQAKATIAGRQPLLERLSPTAETDPATAVLIAFAEVENAFRERLARAGGQVPRNESWSVWLRLAEDQGVISKETADAIYGLTMLRNLAAHSTRRKVTFEEAMEYLSLADGVIYGIDREARKQR